MLESSKEEEDISYLLEYQDDENFVDPKINPEGLIPGHFSDCMNNGGHQDSILILTLPMKVFAVK